MWREQARYEPAMGEDERASLLAEWARAVERSKDWARD
jgi:glycerol kinase